MSRNTIFNRLVKPLVFIFALLPALYLPLLELGANPVERLTHYTGDWAIRLLLITLAVTPFQKITGIGEVVRLRRMFGLYAFFYAVLHAGVYFILDQGFSLSAIFEDIIKRPYITVGFTVFVLLIPLAVTSTNAMMRRLGGRNWKRLHRSVYLCGLGAVVHYLWLVKADLREPLIYLVILLLLLGYRMLLWLHKREWHLPGRISLFSSD